MVIKATIVDEAPLSPLETLKHELAESLTQASLLFVQAFSSRLSEIIRRGLVQ